MRAGGIRDFKKQGRSRRSHRTGMFQNQGSNIQGPPTVTAETHISTRQESIRHLNASKSEYRSLV